jgi:hypothetical protein
LELLDALPELPLELPPEVPPELPDDEPLEDDDDDDDEEDESDELDVLDFPSVEPEDEVDSDFIAFFRDSDG